MRSVRKLRTAAGWSRVLAGVGRVGQSGAGLSDRTSRTEGAGESEAGPDRQRVRLRLTVAFDGTAYEGWQVQKIGRGVQGVVEEALARLFPSRPRLHSSSRTDAGVHALGMVAHCDVERGEWRMASAKLRLALNAHLPEDVRVVSAARVEAGFHARFGARGKQYRYHVWNHPAMNPLLRHQAWHVPRALDVAAIREAAAALVGRRDFRAFTANPGYTRRCTVRNLTRLTVSKRGALLTFTIEANGFLYKMCRGLVGTLVEVGLGRLAAGDMARILASADRRVAGMSAPAHGLVLWRVNYGRRMPSEETQQTSGEGTNDEMPPVE
jgi:tRNA pseudouridine38-40 synthase